MNSKSTFWGVILVVLGSILFLDQLLPDFDLDKYLVPILLIVGGILLIFRDKIKNINQ